MTTEYARTPADEALRIAIEQDDVTGVENLLRQQSQIININDIYAETTPLMLAAQRKSNYRTVSAILHHGADPNICSTSTGTALHYACFYQTFDVIEILLKFKANVNCQSFNGQTPLHLLILLYRMPLTTDHDCLRCIRLLLDNYANVNIHDVYGMSCVFYAIKRVSRRNFKLDIIRLLLNSSSIDVNSQLLLRPYGRDGIYINGDTILHCALKEENLDIVNLILVCCCTTPDLLICNSNNETAYDIAQQLHYKPIMESLKMTLLHQCHLFLRQTWIEMKPENKIILSLRKRQKKK